MPVSPLRVAVVGCGSAGPAAALWLARAGHRVEIFERASELQAVGAGLLLQPTGLWALADLGLRDEAEATGARVAGLVARTRGGRRLLDLEYECVAPGAAGLGMHRASLHSLLLGAARKARVALHLGSPVEGAPLERGARWLSVDGARLGPFDLVIVASGAGSDAWSWTGLPGRARRHPWGALWVIAPDPERGFPDRLVQVVDGTHTMAGFLPTGTRSDDPDATPLVSLFWSVRADQVNALRRRGLAPLKDAIRRLAPESAPLLDGIDSMHRWSFAEYHDVVLPRWHAPALAVLGDAGHAMSPQLGQGVDLALWDARELALSLALEDDLDRALARYSRERGPHLAFYQRASRWLTPFFQSSIPGAGPLRDLLLPLAGRIPWMERQMVLAMAGVKTGPFDALPWRPEPPRRPEGARAEV